MALGPLLVFALNVSSAVVAILASYYAYKFARIAESPLLNSITAGFMLLGVGLLVEAGTSVALQLTLIDVLGSKTLAVVETFAYLSIQMLAYLVFAAGYAVMVFGRSARASALAVGGAVTAKVVDVAGLYGYALLSYFVVLVLLAFVVFQGVLIHSRSRSRFSLYILLGFSLILGAHAVLLASVASLSGILFLGGTLLQFLGFVSILLFLLRSGRVGAG